MGEPKRVNLSRIGGNQTVCIPVDMEMMGDEAIIYRDGDRLILEPVEAASILDLLETWVSAEGKLPEIDCGAARNVEIS